MRAEQFYRREIDLVPDRKIKQILNTKQWIIGLFASARNYGFELNEVTLNALISVIQERLGDGHVEYEFSDNESENIDSLRSLPVFINNI